MTHALESADFLVVQDIFLTETAKLADVVLPAACWAEKEGTFTCTERKVQRVRQAVEPPGEAKPDWVILSEIAKRLGLSFNYTEPREIFDEMAALSPIYGGISYARLERQDLHWPCPTNDHPGTPFLHQEKFGRGLGLFSGIAFRPSEELPDEEFPFFLTTGRHYAHYNARTMTGRCPTLAKEYSRAITQMHVNDAEKLGLRDGDSDPGHFPPRRGENVGAARHDCAGRGDFHGFSLCRRQLQRPPGDIA